MAHNAYTTQCGGKGLVFLGIKKPYRTLLDLSEIRHISELRLGSILANRKRVNSKPLDIVFSFMKQNHLIL